MCVIINIIQGVRVTALQGVSYFAEHGSENLWPSPDLTSCSQQQLERKTCVMSNLNAKHA